MKNTISTSILLFIIVFISIFISFIFSLSLFNTNYIFKSIDSDIQPNMVHSIIKNSVFIISFVFLIIVLIVRLFSFVYVSKGNYERNTECVIDPISAESIIDGKIDTSNLIMTCITNLLYKKNLELINPSTVKIINTDNITKIEKEVLILLSRNFGNKYYYIKKYNNNIINDIEKGKEIDFSKFKTLFKNKDSYTINFYEKLINIKKIIKEKLVNNHIINNTWTNILHFIKVISSFLLINSFFIFSPYTPDLIKDYLMLLLLVEPLILILLFSNNPKIIVKKPKNLPLGYAFIILEALTMIISFIYSNPKNLIELLIFIFINIIIYNFSNTFVLTKTGKIEYEKALKLKQYIEDYSLIQERDIDGIIIWDEYLIYATAFGIPSKVTQKMAESLMNLNISIQVFNSFF